MSEKPGRLVNSLTMEEYLHDFRLWLQDAEFLREKNSQLECWKGTIYVEWLDPANARRCVANHKIAIILPAGFPYHAPIVISQDSPPLSPSWHFAPEPLYSLCLWNSPNDWQPHLTAQWLLQRVEEWFTHYHTNTWPANSQFPDLHRYLDCHGLVVIGDDWQPPQGEQSGSFVFWKPRKLTEILPFFAVCRKNIAVQLEDSELASSLSITSENRVKSSGVWFRLTKPFFPVNTLRDLLALIDNNLEQVKGWSRNKIIHGVGLKPPAGGFPIALGYTDYQNQERWLFLWVQLPGFGNKRQKVPWSRPRPLARIRVTSLQTAPARKHDLLRRTAYMSKRLENRKAIIFGVGSLGSSVALLLAQAGVGEIRLVDSDILMPGNVVRHACGLNLVGFPKTVAVQHTIQSHHPGCHVLTFAETWEDDKLISYMEGCNLVIDTTANYNFSLLLNEVCIARSVPAIFATAYRRATIGRIIVHRDRNDPCLACYANATNFWDQNDYPIIPRLAEAQFIEDGCGAVTEEAVALDVNTIANLTVRVAVKVFWGELGDSNLALLVNEAIPGATATLAQEGTHWRINKPLEQCMICRS